MKQVERLIGGQYKCPSGHNGHNKNNFHTHTNIIPPATIWFKSNITRLALRHAILGHKFSVSFSTWMIPICKTIHIYFTVNMPTFCPQNCWCLRQGQTGETPRNGTAFFVLRSRARQDFITVPLHSTSIIFFCRYNMRHEILDTVHNCTVGDTILDFSAELCQATCVETGKMKVNMQALKSSVSEEEGEDARDPYGANEDENFC
mmetsp:Transcript_15036/g.33518  ORF Transcript_15036/g.33518 Transcript_15036/m.33518 type:complete len:204 (+) Transcript_15036:1640-2251(+)